MKFFTIKSNIYIMNFFLIFTCAFKPVWNDLLNKKDNKISNFEYKLEPIMSSIDKQDLMIVKELFKNISLNNIEFKTSPNPSFLFKKFLEENKKSKNKNNYHLNILSYNVSLQENKIDSLIKNQIIEILPFIIFRNKFDIILLQGIWAQKDINNFVQTAQTNGYIAFASDKEYYNDGLISFVKSEIIDLNKLVLYNQQPFLAQGLELYVDEQLAVGGYQSVSFEHKKIGNLSFFNTQMDESPNNWANRIDQSKELGLQVNLLASKQSGLALVGGNINAAPYYKYDEWTDYNNNTTKNWYKNTLGYYALLYYGDLDDLFIKGASKKNYLNDKKLFEHISKSPSKNNFDWCEKNNNFTVSDCNSLYEKQYGGKHMPARVDHIFAHDKESKIYVKNRKLEFVDKVVLSCGLETELSSHYGISLNLEIQK